MRARPALLILTILALGFAGLTADAADPVASSVALNPLSKLNPLSFRSFVERPLFSPDRRAPQLEKDSETANAPPPEDNFDIKLLGITVTPDGATARIKDNGDGTLHSFNPGDVFNKWRVISIDANTVAMSKDGDKRIYSLFEKDDGRTDVRSGKNPLNVNTVSRSEDSDRCANAGHNCDDQERQRQDLIDFFGSKAK